MPIEIKNKIESACMICSKGKLEIENSNYSTDALNLVWDLRNLLFETERDFRKILNIDKSN